MKVVKVSLHVSSSFPEQIWINNFGIANNDLEIFKTIRSWRTRKGELMRGVCLSQVLNAKVLNPRFLEPESMAIPLFFVQYCFKFEPSIFKILYLFHPTNSDSCGISLMTNGNGKSLVNEWTKVYKVK